MGRYHGRVAAAVICGHDAADRAGDVPGAYTLGDGIAGTSQLVVDEVRGVLVGATFTGPGIQELLHSATVAVAGAVPLDSLWHAVPSFPTVSEVWLHLLEGFGPAWAGRRERTVA